MDLDKQKTIIIADSCIGGIGILEKINQWAGDFNVIYLADYEKNAFHLEHHSRNLGLPTEEEQTKIDETRLSIAGCGVVLVLLVLG